MIDKEIDLTRLGIDLSKHKGRSIFLGNIKKGEGLDIIKKSSDTVHDKIVTKLTDQLEFTIMREFLLDANLYCHRCGRQLKLDVLLNVYHSCLCNKCDTELHNEMLLKQINNKQQKLEKSDRVVRSLLR